MIPPAAGGLYPTCFADFVGNLVKLRGRREEREREREILSPSWLAISRLSSAFRASSRITTKDDRRLAESIDPSTSSVSPSPGERGRCQSSILRNNPFFGEQSFPAMNFKGNRSSCWYRDCYGNCYRTVCIGHCQLGERERKGRFSLFEFSKQICPLLLLINYVIIKKLPFLLNFRKWLFV